MHQLGMNFIIGKSTYKTKGIYLNRVTLKNEHELWLDSVYSAVFKAKSGIFIDVGANTGQTLIKVLSIDENIEYIGFEPQLDCCYFIEQFIKQNALHSHTILPIGLSSKSDVVHLLKRNTNADTTASIIDGFRPSDFYAYKQAIYVNKGDEIIDDLNLSEISTIKVDVEGGELEVLLGLNKTIVKFKPFIIFEVLNNFLTASGMKLDEENIKFRMNRVVQLESILFDANYQIFNILPGNKLVQVSNIKPLTTSDLEMTDYVAVHDDYRSAFVDLYEGEVS